MNGLHEEIFESDYENSFEGEGEGAGVSNLKMDPGAAEPVEGGFDLTVDRLAVDRGDRRIEIVR